jgi:HK97 gp10 family phage protein
VSNDVDVRGFRELDNLLRELPNKLAGKALTNAVNEGARIIRDEARANVPVRTGQLRRSIRTFVRRKGVETGIAIAIGVRGKLAYIARFLEFGTKAHRIVATGKSLDVVQVKSVDHPGTSPNPFLTRAFDTKARAAVDAIRTRLRAELDKIVAAAPKGRR